MLKKIMTKEELDKKAKRNQIIVGVILVSLLVISTAGYSLRSSNKDDAVSSVSERGYDFYFENGLWKTDLSGNIFAFQYLPSEVENVTIEGEYDVSKYSNQPIYFVGSSPGISEVLNNLGRYALRYQQACLNDSSECGGGLPMKDCNSNLIVFGELEGESRVSSEDSCVYIFGDSVRGADAFLYKVLKIMN